MCVFFMSGGNDRRLILLSVAQRTIALPFHNNLSAEQVEYVCETLIRTQIRI